MAFVSCGDLAGLFICQLINAFTSSKYGIWLHDLFVLITINVHLMCVMMQYIVYMRHDHNEAADTRTLTTYKMRR